MAKATQEGRLLSISTNLGQDFILISRLSVTEEVSKLYAIDVNLLYDDQDEVIDARKPTALDPAKILGQPATISITQTDGGERYFNGIFNSISFNGRDLRYSHFSATIVPQVWELTQISQSRIFQQKDVEEILKVVFAGYPVKIQLTKDYKPRNYCAQYDETDFDFASRLMEEEGISYYFEFAENSETMIITDNFQNPRDCPTKCELGYINQDLKEEHFESAIKAWLLNYKLQTGKVLFWDHNFQLPEKKLEVEQTTRFKVGGNEKLEVYKYPAGYARKYDGISKDGSEQKSDLDNIYTDNDRTAKNRIESLEASYIISSGESDCCTLTSGHRFHLKNHPNSDYNLPYILLSITHDADQSPAYSSNNIVAQAYRNYFTCIPHGSGKPEFRPELKTPKPIVRGSQTAIVVGPPNEEIFTDKYGRVKVQFHWDRDGKNDSDSSCWIRVAQAWAGNRWGMMFLPRIGMEVIVQFLEGNPDNPIITGCVYKADSMPPYELPKEKTKMTIKSDSSLGGQGFNEIRFEDKKGKEQVFLHGQKDQDIRIKSNRREIIGNDRHLIVKRDQREKIERDVHTIIERDLIEDIQRDYHRHVEGKIAFKTDGSMSHDIGSKSEKVGGNYAIDAGDFNVKAKNIVLEASTGLTIKVGGNFVTVNSAGVQINGTMVLINSGGVGLPLIPGSIVPPLDPEEAEIADNADPGSKAPTYKNQRRAIPPARLPSFVNPSHKPKSPKNKDKKSWIEIELKDDEGNPIIGERYRVTLPDGNTLAEGTTNEKGQAKVTNIDPGSCKITFPELDGAVWSKE